LSVFRRIEMSGIIPVILGANALLHFTVGATIMGVAGVAAYDKFFSKDPFKRKYPLIARLLPVIDWGGKFWRSHVALADREELPFNREQRAVIRRLSFKKSNTIGFGSTQDINSPGSAVFTPSMFPPLDADTVKTSSVIIGPYSKNPYEAKSIFNISAMSYGSVSSAFIRALSTGAKKSDCWLNTGEGGLSPYHLEGGCDIVLQIGTAKYGVRKDDGSLDEDKLKEISEKPEVKMIEIKLAQGAKPGKGGILPAVKVTKEISEIRGIPEGKDSISPNRFPEVSNVNELLDFIEKIRDISGLPVGIKTVIVDHAELEELCQAICERGEKSAPDFITFDGGDGGSGAAPQVLMDNVGKTLRQGLTGAIDIIKNYNLRERIKIVASGKLVTPFDVAWAVASGADFINSARGPMTAAGCLHTKRCHTNKCPAGIATQDKRRQKVLDPVDKGEKVGNYILGMQKQLEMLAHSCGLKEPREFKPQHMEYIKLRDEPIPANANKPQVTKKQDVTPNRSP
jgi:glutamate synthase domain-containing protein 2